MTWNGTTIAALVLVAKDAGIHLTESICRKLDLGQSVEKDLDYLYLISNIVFALEHDDTADYGTLAAAITDDELQLTDDNYSLLAEMVNRIAVQRNRYRGL